MASKPNEEEVSDTVPSSDKNYPQSKSVLHPIYSPKDTRGDEEKNPFDSDAGKPGSASTGQALSDKQSEARDTNENATAKTGALPESAPEFTSEDEDDLMGGFRFRGPKGGSVNQGGVKRPIKPK
ncbi:hypothetical protein PLICRDRAFT_42061 [Plicaturopsis crispa FD-325 SS-3]|nr:hypothetical protein PLICRDRAFT_42061 [Plicaturopsis crispa FD-325 SS-3]